MSVLDGTPSQPLEVMSDSEMNMASPSPATKRKLSSEEKQSDKVDTCKRVKANEIMSPEQEAKRAEKEEKKRQRDLKKAEKDKKEAEKEAKRKKEAQAKAKAASFMSSFIQRPRSASPVKVEGKTATLSDFDKAFQACVYKDVAPINRFNSTASSSKLNSTSEADREDQEHLLHAFKASCPLKKTKSSRSRRGIHSTISVRESMRLITEASVMGDEKLEENGKRGLNNLSDRKRVPMKLLHFASDRRPAWYGTWTRTTNLVGARKPLGQDPVALDYSYDSEAEWEDEDPNDGDDLLDNDDKEEEDGEKSDDDSEMDDWLVDDLEEEEEEEVNGPLEDLDFFEVDAKGQPVAPTRIKSSIVQPAKGLVNFLQPKKKKIKPIGRRFDAKLVPFSTGPHWQETLGETSYDGFKGYQIEFLNDARPGLNPFTFESAEVLPAVEAEVGPLNSFVNSKANSSPAANKAPGGVASAGTLAKAQTFPNQHLTTLLKSIEGNTSIRPILVEDLKNKFAHLGKVVTKANIDACVNVYAEKLSKKLGAKWVVREEYRSIAGVQETTTATTAAAATAAT